MPASTLQRRTRSNYGQLTGVFATNVAVGLHGAVLSLLLGRFQATHLQPEPRQHLQHERRHGIQDMYLLWRLHFHQQHRVHTHTNSPWSDRYHY